MIELTKKQYEVFEYIKLYIENYKYSPTIREIGYGIGSNSPATIHEFVKALNQKDVITMKENKARTINIINYDVVMKDTHRETLEELREYNKMAKRRERQKRKAKDDEANKL